MNCKWIGFAIVSLLSAAGLADTFQLRDAAAGKVYGPFELKDGVEITAGNARYIITGVATGQAGAEVLGPEALLKATLLPAVEMRSAKLEDALAFVRESVRRAHPGHVFNMVVNIPAADPFAPGSKTVTLDLKQISAWQAVQEICKQAGCTMQYDGDLVEIAPVKEGAP